MTAEGPTRIEWYPMDFVRMMSPAGTRVLLWFDEGRGPDSVTSLWNRPPKPGTSVFVGAYFRRETIVNGDVISSSEGWRIEGLGDVNCKPSMWAFLPEPTPGQVADLHALARRHA